jgi:hypothetical protein
MSKHDINHPSSPDTSATSATTATAQTYWLLKAAQARKLGKQAKGSIGYQLLTDDTRRDVSLIIVSNDSGGYFSRETVQMVQVQACIDALKQGQPFPSKQLQAAFKGRSSNNAGFLAAILRQENLLALAPETEGQHVMCGDWPAWKAALLSEKGTPIQVASKVTATESAPEQASDHMEQRKTLTALPRKKL